MSEELNFIADEGVEREIVLALRKRYDITSVAETMQSAADDIILNKAEEEKRVLITLDKDFGELVFHRNKLHAGVILCRVQSLPIVEAVSLVSSTIDKYGMDLKNSFTVIQPKNTRIRKQKT